MSSTQDAEMKDVDGSGSDSAAAETKTTDRHAAAQQQTPDNDDNHESGNDDDDDDDDEEDEDDDSDESSEPPAPRVLPSRSTRGHRLTDIHGEGDDDFWEQEFFTEEAEADDDYEYEDAKKDEQPDVYDSDFFEDESEEDEDEEVEVEKEKRPKKKGAYVDPKLVAAKRAAAAKKAAATKAARKAAAAAAQDKAAQEEAQQVQYDEESGFPTASAFISYDGVAPPSSHRRRTPASLLSSPTSLLAGRKSIRSSTKQKTEDLVKREVEKQAKAKQRKPKQIFKPRILTQEEQLAMSVDTEKENRASLEELLRIEAEKKKELAPKAKPKGPRIIMRDRKNEQGFAKRLITFTAGEWPDYLQPPMPTPPLRNLICPITGQPARYWDPLTQQPYANAQAFTALRQRFNQEPQAIQLLQQQLHAKKMAAQQQAAQEYQLAAQAAGLALPQPIAKPRLASPTPLPAQALAVASPTAARKRKLEEVKSSPVPATIVASPAASPTDDGASPKAAAKKKPRVSKAASAKAKK